MSFLEYRGTPQSLNDLVFLGQVAKVDQALLNSTVLVDATGLSFSVSANAIWHFEAWIPFTLGGVTSGYKFGVSVPAAPNNIGWSAKVYNQVLGTLVDFKIISSGAGTVSGALATSGLHFCEIKGIVDVSGSGNLTIQFAQNTADAVNPITIKRGAHLKLWPFT